MTELADDLADALEPGQVIKVYWPDDPDAPEAGPGVIVLDWGGDGPLYDARGLDDD